jgi:hypothetical protein
MNDREREILNRLSNDEISALAYGFPMPNAKYYSNFNESLASTGYETDVNGAFRPLKATDNNFDGGFDFVDEDAYSNFWTKKSRERMKRTKELKEDGKSRKDARKQALDEIGRDKLKDVAKNLGKGVGRSIVVGTLAVPRASYLSLLALNFRGNAYKVMAIVNKTKGNSDALLKELKDKWYKLGGDWGLLVRTAENGAKKNPFFCGKKCKTALAKNDYKKSFDGSTSIRDVDFESFSYVAGYDDVAIGVWIGLGSAVLSAIGTITGKAIESKTEKDKIASEELIAKKELESLDAKTKLEADLKEKEIASSVDPKNAIVTNPDLTAQEKSLALKQLDEATTKETSQNFKKFALYGLIGVGVIYLLTKVMKNK